MPKEIIMERRQFLEVSGKGALGVAVLTATAGTAGFVMEGCTLTVDKILTDIENWVPVGLAAFQAIVTLLDGAAAPLAPIVSIITAAFNQVVADIKMYQAITPPPAGALASIEAALQIIVTNFQAFLSSLNITDSKLVTLVIGFAEIILNTIAGFAAQLGSTSTALHVEVAKTVTVSGKTVAVTASTNTLTRRSFKKAWNKVAVAGSHPECELALTFWEHF
jgi:hypothetical protein